jgi:transposase
MGAVDLGSAIEPVWRAFSGSCERVPDGGFAGAIPRWVHLLAAAADVSEHRLAEGTLGTVKVPRRGPGRPRSRLRRVIADRGCDSDPLRGRLKKRGTRLIAPYRSNNRHRRFEDQRKLRRYRKRWKIERTNAWLQNFRRIQVRYDHLIAVFQGFFHFACLLITLRRLCN